ncbi:DUF1735 domain-containing protein [Panacibacter ginsenosidivorans]|uniref:DUF1735 domain-containing protein n=1 Tax=Panacibacter ginsenosidivorans TaxID=1813871 RepID=A0A5B8VEY0_9BACT|nr:DUF1735 domain-containing protein [Panacibacter ginsenosidivorans]QEC70054.1 DUF1735 domain-containing protein [Panacibacter ginsenosidivorans]
MKLHKINSSALAVALMAVSLTGCLKDKDYDNGLIQSVHATGATPSVVEIKLTAGDVSNFLIASYDNSDADTTVDLIPVNLATHDAAPEDLHITLSPKQSLVDNYNAANGSEYGDPSAFFSVEDGGVVTIPKGSHTGFLKIKFKPSDFLGGAWAVGFEITSIQESGYTISGNLKTGIVALVIKNAYDGIYTSTGYLYHPSAPRSLADNKTVSTIDANTVSVTLGDLGGAGYEAWLTVDPVTNKVTVTAAPGAAGAPYTQFDDGLPTTNPGYTAQWDGSAQCNNTYDPATHTFYVRYGYQGSTGWRVTEEILVKQ